MALARNINQTGDEPQKQDTEANKRTPHLREEVPYQITLIRLRQWQGSLDRGRREKVIRKMFKEDDCYPFTDLEGGRCSPFDSAKAPSF